MNQDEINKKLALLDGRGSVAEYGAIELLSTLDVELPDLLYEKYKQSKKWGERISCVYHSIKFAKSSESAYLLGIEALGDKSKKVRYRACMLLAVAQKEIAILSLSTLLKDNDTAEDAKAAIDAIRKKNQNYFVDRNHSGKVSLNV